MTATPLSIGFLSIRDASNPRIWSGTPFHMAESLKACGADVRPIGPMDAAPLRSDIFMSKLRNRIGVPATTPTRSLHAASAFGAQIRAALANAPPDILFSPAGSVLLAGLGPDVPVVYSSDATVDLMKDYYPKFAKLSRWALRQAEELERRAIERADLIVYPTAWAAASALSHYGAEPAKVHVVPYGANLEAPEREATLAERPDGPLKLLFIGVNWERKGGAIAIEALDALTARGVDAEMTVIGCIPPEETLRPNVTVIPFLDKNHPGQRQQISDQYLSADFLVLPTRQECFGIVFCEAAAHGVPSITTATGGVPDVVLAGVTGQTLPPEARGDAYADAIETILATKGGIASARVRARNDYEARLNWEVWAKTTCRLMQDVLAR